MFDSQSSGLGTIILNRLSVVKSPASMSVIAFHEKAGRSQVVSLSFLFVTRFFSAELPTVATLPSALFDERVFSLGASWFSGCPRGHRVYTEAGCQGTVRLQAFS